jgi:hypothetical protein
MGELVSTLTHFRPQSTISPEQQSHMLFSAAR